ncbi:PD-(D/E)XK nuclease-like domain-containing protein [Candidatus Pacearchaeota archaeon]|nr:PD-(D/E)XK nuclease-like domain-containing protein [Candidatus Pacearchaeota archaeon]
MITDFTKGAFDENSNDRPVGPAEVNSGTNQKTGATVPSDINIGLIGLHADISNWDYHKSAGLSSTSIKKAKVPSDYKLHIDGKLPFKKTDSMTIGTALHALVLEPETFKHEVAIAPSEPKRPTKAQLNAKKRTDKAQELIDFWSRWDAKHAHIETHISIDTMSTIINMRDELMEHPEARETLEDVGNRYEQSGWYEDPESGLLCKYRPDLKNNWCLADLKSCADASFGGFMKAIGNLEYHVSAAHYLEGERALGLSDHNLFRFLAVESTYPHRVAVYDLTGEDLARGYKARNKYINTIKACTESGVWPGLNNNQAVDTRLPKYFGDE